MSMIWGDPLQCAPGSQIQSIDDLNREVCLPRQFMSVEFRHLLSYIAKLIKI